ncbi:hypothetical protein BC936DRAFT_143083 [Jimgerdemannia flammicorona]|uniref:Uncharacterized protein n=1 Tax=Jimgerdemannia flammicorona TaxID=994334 RepID=A0A432ZZF7_9FUNG|nr:hypothetical protein BC936DRAFT_143083 [Jimgerdemannia flammicorona]
MYLGERSVRYIVSMQPGNREVGMQRIPYGCRGTCGKEHSRILCPGLKRQDPSYTPRRGGRHEKGKSQVPRPKVPLGARP